MPNLAAIEVIAAHSDSYSLFDSATKRTARCRNSAGYCPRRSPMTPSFPIDGVPENTGAVQFEPPQGRRIRRLWASGGRVHVELAEAALDAPAEVRRTLRRRLERLGGRRVGPRSTTSSVGGWAGSTIAGGAPTAGEKGGP